MDANLIVALIVGIASPLLTLFGVIFANRKTQALTEYKIEELTREVHEHNRVIQRTYELEKRADLVDAEINRVNHRLSNLEKE